MRKLWQFWDTFLTEKKDLSVCGVIRIGYAILLLLWLGFLIPNFDKYFSESGYLSYQASRATIGQWTLTIFSYLPLNDLTVRICATIFAVQILCLLFGFWTRFNACCIYFWLTSFQHRVNIIMDGEDTVFRFFAFFQILMPAGAYYSIDSRRLKQKELYPVWPLRLLQIQMTLIYLSTAIEKAKGPEWWNGDALYYVSRLDDTFGKFPVPSAIFNSLATMHLMTLIVLIFEILLPFCLWIPKTRKWALLAAFTFHLSVEYSMNLFLFHWIMMLGLLSFCDWGAQTKEKREGGAIGDKKLSLAPV